MVNSPRHPTREHHVLCLLRGSILQAIAEEWLSLHILSRHWYKQPVCPISWHVLHSSWPRASLKGSQVPCRRKRQISYYWSGRVCFTHTEDPCWWELRN